MTDLRPEDWRLSVAPMLDWTDRHCRYFHRLLTTRTRLYTEMVTTGAIIFGDREKTWDAVTVEDIVAANPDFIIIHDYKGSSYDDKVAALKENPELKYLDCVRNECFIKLSLENVMPGMRSAVTVETIAQAMYADLFAEPEPTAAPEK